jgi:hypothetical protein
MSEHYTVCINYVRFLQMTHNSYDDKQSLYKLKFKMRFSQNKKLKLNTIKK